VESNTGKMKKEYIARINRVMDYIDNNLDRQISLDEVAEVALFSKFHFHRIFASITGETIYTFIQRLKMERAAEMLLSDRENPVTVIALDLGFSSIASFSRYFKDYYGISPTEWRSGGWKDSNKCILNRKNRETQRNIREDYTVIPSYNEGTLIWRITMKKETVLETKVEICENADMHVAYVRHVGPYAGDVDLFGTLWGKLMKWAGPRGLFIPGETKMLTIYHDSPEITDESKLRISVCITIPEETQVEGEIGKMLVPGGRYGVGHFEIDVDQYGAAWDSMYSGWLPESGFQCDDRPCFELCLNDPNEHPEGKHIVDIYVPVKPL
jgi:AraC family transcriptional regulator